MTDLVTEPDVMAITRYRTNAEMILDVRRLGYLPDDALVLDATYGLGVWWKKYRPSRLITNDLYAGYPDVRFDYRGPAPFADETFDVVAYDPDYKLNGTPTKRADERYGVHIVKTRAQRLQDMYDGLRSLSKLVKPGGHMLVKCQNQVNGNHVRFQMVRFFNLAEGLGFEVEEILLPQFGYRKQPGKRQVHARQNYSVLLVITKPKGRRKRS